MLSCVKTLCYVGDDEDDALPAFTLDETASEYQAMVNFEEKTSQEMPPYSNMEEFIRLIKDYVNPALESYDEAWKESAVEKEKEYLEAKMLKFARTLRYEEAKE